MMFSKKNWLLFLILAAMLIACGGAAQEQFSEAAEPGGSFDESTSFVTAEDRAFSSEELKSNTTNQQISQEGTQERLIIRTGDLSLIVEDTEASLAAITNLVEAAGGWVVSSEVYQYSDRAYMGDITVRVPADGYASMLGAVKNLAIEVTRESSSGQDVTDEFVDLSSRLGNLEATAARVRNFLDEAKNVDDALAVNVELSRLEEEIELIKGRMQYLSQSAAFSTISIHLTPDVAAQPIEVAGWRPEGIAKDAIESLIKTLQGLAGIAIWLVLFLLPIGIVLGVPLWLLIRFGRRRWQARVARRTAVPPTLPE